MITTRFAPSPTGFLHIGGIRTALFSWLWAKKNSGKFLLRIEDTDLKRNKEDALLAILESFKWMKINYDEEVIYQSKRLNIYKKYINQLLEEGKAYKCYVSKDELNSMREEQISKGERARYNRKYRDFNGVLPENIESVIRIKAPINKTINFKDGVKGEISISSDEVDDFIISRSDGSPTYNFVVVIDDILMNVTDIIRGDDHLYNTPKQIIIYEALGFKVPNFYHVAMINNEDGKKLSKRDGALDIMEYKKKGFLPKAILNFIVRLGWSYKDKEIFSINEMIEIFNPKDINKSSSNFNIDKLLWLNSYYIKNMENTELILILKDYGLDISENKKIDLILESTKSRSKTILELINQINMILNKPIKFNTKKLEKLNKIEIIDILNKFLKALEINKESFYDLIHNFVKNNNISFSKIGQPLRISLLGDIKGDGLDKIIYILEEEETIKRIKYFITYFNKLILK